MSDSLSTWLALREAADARARSVSLLETVVRHLPHARPLRMLDLGTGTGSNIRYLSPRLPRPHEWLAVDRDPALLAEQPQGIERRCLELGPLDPDIFAGRHFVTASALLDLVSKDWIGLLAERCRAAAASVVFALTYDGRSSCSPAEDEDEMVRLLFNQHQRRSDKGFGLAAGPDAVPLTIDALDASGFVVLHEHSDWDLAPEEDTMQRELINGWAEAAIEVDGSKARTIRDWLARRIAHVDEGRSRIRVGHQDIGAWIRGSA